jgi:D-alanyl-D-alanine carboxypeptidase
MAKLTQNETRLTAVVAILIVLGLATIYGADKESAALQSKYQSDRQTQEALAAFFQTDDNADAVYVYDATAKKVLFEKNAEAILPLASITKLATALTAKEVFSADTKITISDSALAYSGENGLAAGEVWSLDTLTAFMLMISSNDAAHAIKQTYDASRANNGENFMSMMNAYGKKIGLEHTTFYDPAGLDSGSRPGAVGTAKDMSTLILAFQEEMPDASAETIKPGESYRDESGKSHLISNTNDLSVHIDTLLASKTGYTNLAGGNLAVAYRMPVFGNTIVIVVLGSTREGRFVAIDRYMAGVENYFKISQK